MKLWLLPLLAVFAVAACSQETQNKARAVIRAAELVQAGLDG